MNFLVLATETAKPDLQRLDFFVVVLGAGIIAGIIIAKLWRDDHRG